MLGRTYAATMYPYKIGSCLETQNPGSNLARPKGVGYMGKIFIEGRIDVPHVRPHSACPW